MQNMVGIGEYFVKQILICLGTKVIEGIGDQHSRNRPGIQAHMDKTGPDNHCLMNMTHYLNTCLGFLLKYSPLPRRGDINIFATDIDKEHLVI